MFTKNTYSSSLKRAGQFEDQSSDAETVLEVPEDLSALNDSEVESLLSQAQEAFTGLYYAGEDEARTDFSDDEFATLEELTSAIESLRAEETKRAEAAAERAQKAADFAVRVNGETVSEDDAKDVDITTEEADDSDESASADTEELAADTEEKTEADETEEAVTASSAPKGPRRVNISGLRKNQSQQKREEPAEMKIEDVLVASANVPGVEAGTGMNWLGAADIVENRLRSFNKSSFDAARRSGRHIKQQFAVASVRRQYGPEVTVADDSNASVESAMKSAVDESRLPGGSLVASGGWCAPSETIYDFMETETREGLFSLPEINVARGGIRYTNGTDFTSLFANLQDAIWDVSEEEDIAGDYQNAGAESDKPCLTIDCPEFEDHRLRLAGLCLSAGLLQQRGYPEWIARTIRGSLVAHDHLVSGRILRDIENGSDAVTMPANQVGATAPLLTALDLQAQHYRTVSRMSPNATLEAVFPMWVKGLLRADLARRQGVDLFDVSDQRINGWMADRHINPQFVYNFHDLSGDAADLTAFPNEVQFLLYSAGTWVRGSQDVITLDTVYDSQTLRQNDYTALFTEEGYLVAKRGADSRFVTVPVCANGGASAGEAIACNGTASAGGSGE